MHKQLPSKRTGVFDLLMSNVINFVFLRYLQNNMITFFSSDAFAKNTNLRKMYVLKSKKKKGFVLLCGLANMDLKKTIFVFSVLNIALACN